MIVNQDNVPVLLIVDDEARILSALQRLLRREPYQLRVAGSGAEALTVLETETIDVVLSDYRMPGMDGLALMREIQARHIGVERVLMSGNADLRLVIDAVNEGHISQFVEKPWGDGALKILLSRLFLNQKLARENQELIKAVQKQNTLLLQESEKAVMGIRQKERLFATISHEIRNPLHGIQGILEILTQDRQLADSAKKLLSTAVTSAAFMRQILDDVLDYSKSEAGKMSLQEKLFLPVALVEDLVSLMQPMADSRQLSLKISYEPIIEHQHYIGDDFRIRQILNNLLSNAIKYTESGGVEITITTGPGITFSVSDTGIGIPSDKRSSLFEAFTMVDESHDRTFGGTGLGLSIVKNLTDLMSGEISVEERTGGGSTFVVHLPLAKGQAEATTESAPDISQVIQGMQVVVADDMAANRLIVENVLSRYGASVYSFPEGDSLLTFLAETKIKPDLILLDINMPGLKGDSVLHAIRELPSMLAEVPAFAMSASLNFEGSERITQQFTGLFSKPFSVGQLLELARSYAPSQLRPVSEARVP
ncbi:MAG: response regulator, partial [Proteobacteria bacterium]|nr:response regulator [Pseudomonadota bacterium]